MKKIKFPNSDIKSLSDIEIEKNVVIVGANGAGKSRFGAKIEQSNHFTKRISAQRYLQLNEIVIKQDFVKAESDLRGSYKNQPPNNPQNDIQLAIISLFAEESNRDSEYVKKARESEKKIDIPKSVKEKVLDVWNFIFPYRKLQLEKDRVKADNFSGTEMSDGEKVGLYLISQIIMAENNCTVIIDEPELHLHKSLMVRLWNKLEEYRSDCTFIYLTHDLDFAISKHSSKLIWIQSYNNEIWKWKEIAPNKIIPEKLFLEILGSRKPILFVEGDQGSFDIQMYQSYYEDFTIIPCGSCEKVIESVRGLKNNSNLHDKQVFGLIDKDFRLEEQIKAFKQQGIFTLSLNKVENLFLVPEVLDFVCTHLFKEKQKEEIENKIKIEYKAHKEQIIFSAAKFQTQRRLGELFGAIKSKEEYMALKNKLFGELDKCFESVILPEDDADVVEILKVYPKKGLVNKLQNIIDFKNKGYTDLVLNLLSSDKREDLIKIIKRYLPKINSTSSNSQENSE